MSSPGESSATSSSLLARVRAGEAAAWDRLVAVYAPLVWHWCRESGLQEQDRADVVQEVFQAVAGRLPAFRPQPGGTFRGWLRIITRHKICDLFRRREHEPAGAGGSDAARWFGQVAAPPEIDEGPASEEGDRQLLARRILDLLRPEFSEQAWQAFWKTAVEGRPAGDVAAELGMSAGAVRVAKCRVLQRLRAELGEMPE
jgi:RNA polymerase sigma-70 factor (ECF subfamily)